MKKEKEKQVLQSLPGMLNKRALARKIISKNKCTYFHL
jgi:hypothetical protein